MSPGFHPNFKFISFSIRLNFDRSTWPARRKFDRSNPQSVRTLSVDRPLFRALEDSPYLPEQLCHLFAQRLLRFRLQAVFISFSIQPELKQMLPWGVIQEGLKQFHPLKLTTQNLWAGIYTVKSWGHTKCSPGKIREQILPFSFQCSTRNISTSRINSHILFTLKETFLSF